LPITKESEDLISRLNKLDEEEDYKYKLRLFRKIFTPLEEFAKKLGIKSNAKQQEFIDDKSKIVAAICANRSGKTEAGAIKFLNTCLKYPKEKSWVLTESHELQRDGVQPKILEYLKPEDIKLDKYGVPCVKRIDKYTYSLIELVNGHKIIFKSYEQGRKKLQAAKIKQAWFDEEPPEDVFDEVMTRTTDLRGQIFLTFTPLQGLTWSYKRILQKAQGKTIAVYNWGMADNPIIAKEEIEFLKDSLSVKMAKTRLYGKYASSGNIIFSPWDRDIHVKPLKYNVDLETFITVDWGIKVTAISIHQCDPHVIVEDPITKEKKLVEHHYLIKYMELKGHGYPQIIQVIRTLPYILTDYFSDPAQRGRSQTTKTGISLLKVIENEYGIKFKYTKNVGVEESVEIVNSYLMNAKEEARYFVADTETLYMERIEGYKRDQETGDPIKDGINDHCGDITRYYFVNKNKYKYKKWRMT